MFDTCTAGIALNGLSAALHRRCRKTGSVVIFAVSHSLMRGSLTLEVM